MGKRSDWASLLSIFSLHFCKAWIKTSKFGKGYVYLKVQVELIMYALITREPSHDFPGHVNADSFGLGGPRLAVIKFLQTHTSAGRPVKRSSVSTSYYRKIFGE